MPRADRALARGVHYLASLMIGTTIGAYRITQQIGEGGMGAVYIGEHALLGRKVAIKVLLPALSAHQEIVQRFFNEAKAVTQISDPGIVQVFDFGHDAGGNAFIVMELLSGEPMDKRLERIGRFTPIDCLRVMRQICSSLAAAHAKGIVHRDLKPENLFIVGDPAVTGGERAKILDFGIAKLTADEPGKLKTRTGMVMGTPVYMSPEQCRGAGEIDARSDIYSMGCVMMTMLTGRPPFAYESSGDLIVAHMREQAPLAADRLPGLPELFDQILQRCLAKTVEDRYPSMAELVRTLAVADQMMTSASAPAISGDVAGYVASGLTPPPGVKLPTGAQLTTTTPTTLSGASGQQGAAAGGTEPHLRRKRVRLVAAAASAAVVAGLTVMVAVAHRHKIETAKAAADEPMPIASPNPNPNPNPIPNPIPALAAAAVPVDAGVAIVAPDAAPTLTPTPIAAAPVHHAHAIATPHAHAHALAAPPHTTASVPAAPSAAPKIDRGD
jgi:serine/threonine-protein kinase